MAGAEETLVLQRRIVRVNIATKVGFAVTISGSVLFVIWLTALAIYSDNRAVLYWSVFGWGVGLNVIGWTTVIVGRLIRNKLTVRLKCVITATVPTPAAANYGTNDQTVVTPPSLALSQLSTVSQPPAYSLAADSQNENSIRL